MPIYEFRCRECQKVFETLCFSTDSGTDVTCPSCGSHDAQKILSTFCSKNSEAAAGTSPASSSCGSTGGFS